MRRFSRLRWIFLCACGLRHREGEHWFTVGKGFAPVPLSRCTRCGVKRRGDRALTERDGFITDRDLGDETDTRWHGLSVGRWFNIPLSEAFGGIDIGPASEEPDVWVVASVTGDGITYECYPNESAKLPLRERSRPIARP